MSKDVLRKAAEQLIEAERLCRNAYAKAAQNGREEYDRACNTVEFLAEQVRNIHRNIPELSAKQYWWDTPFSPEEPEEEGFCFQQGEYRECIPLRIKEECGRTVLCPKNQIMDYSSLSQELTLGSYIPLFINKKQLRNCMNEAMHCRYIYDTASFQYEESPAPDLTRRKESAADTWKQYQEIASHKHAEHQEYLKSHDETWDTIEKIGHGSLFTNEERWLMGRMDTDDYLRESLLRDSFALDKESKMNEELYRMRVQANKFSQEVREHQMEQRRNALSTATVKNVVRMMPAGHIVYCHDEIMAIFLHKGKEPIVAFECAEDIDIDALEGQCFGGNIRSEKTPALYPLVRQLAKEYKDVLPEVSVLAVRPPNCPEDIWREWIGARWEQKIKG